MKDLARRLAIAQAKYRARQKPPEEPKPNPNDVYAIPDSWTPAARREFEQEPEPEPHPHRPRRKQKQEERLGRALSGDRRKVPEKSEGGWPDVQALSLKRTNKLCVAMSDQEIALVRHFLREKKWGFSDWARRVLFEDANIPIPPRK